MFGLDFEHLVLLSSQVRSLITSRIFIYSHLIINDVMKERMQISGSSSSAFFDIVYWIMDPLCAYVWCAKRGLALHKVS